MFVLGLLVKRFLTSNHSFKYCTSTNPNLTVQYLIKSCGFTESAAISASKKLHLKTTEKPDSVLDFFTSNAFTKPQIHTILTKIPKLLVSTPQKTLKPKIEFLKSVGISDVGVLLSKNPQILMTSLNNQIIPSFDFLKAILPTNHDVIRSFRRSTWILNASNRNSMKTNMGFLREIGVSQSNIIFLINRPRSLLQSPISFKKDIARLIEIGFHPQKQGFIDALFRITGMKDSTWDHKFEVYRRWGWSDRDTLSAFKRRSVVMATSAEKIDQVMDFVVNKMGWDSSDIRKHPGVLGICFKKRIIPRLLVVQFLVSKGLVQKKNVNLSSLLYKREEHFLDMFVNKHRPYVSELLSLYNMNRNHGDEQNDIKILQ